MLQSLDKFNHLAKTFDEQWPAIKCEILGPGKRKKGRINTILFWLFQVREEKREHKRRMKKLESIYKDNVRWKDESRKWCELMRRKFQKDAFDSGEAFGEVCKKSRGSEEGEAEKACKVNISTKKGTKKKVEESKKRKFESFRQSESSCERRRRAQKLKNDLEDGLQLWSQQVYFAAERSCCASNSKIR